MLATSFFDWISKVDDGIVLVSIVMTAGVLIAIGWFVTAAWRSIREADYRTRLTGLMLQRGMSTEEIERILRAGTPPRKPTEDELIEPEARLVKTLADHYYDGGDINKILDAARTVGPIDDAAVRLARPLVESWVGSDEIARVLRSRRPEPQRSDNFGGAANPA